MVQLSLVIWFILKGGDPFTLFVSLVIGYNLSLKKGCKNIFHNYIYFLSLLKEQSKCSAVSPTKGTLP